MYAFDRLLQTLRAFLLGELVRALGVTARHLFVRKLTVQYPDEKTPLSARFRGLHALRRYPNGEERCIACKLCEAVCPACCITIQGEECSDGMRRAKVYDIDLFKCVYCGFCEEACPVDAVVLTRHFEFHFEKGDDFVIRKEQLLAIGDRWEKQIAADRAADAKYR